MPTPKTTHTIIAVLDLKISVQDLIGLVKTIVTNMSASPYFKAPVPPLATISADNAKLETLQATALTKTKGAAAARNAQRAIVTADLHLLKAYVQSVANADEANAETIIKSAGFTVRKATPRVKQDLTLKPGKVSGVINAAAKAAVGRASYDWEYSTDGTTWTALPTTLQAKTVLTGQKAGSTVYVRHRVVTKAGVGDWGQAVSMLVV